MDIVDYLNILIELELNVSRLYLTFSEHLKEDSGFWWKISNEEMNHASILKTAIKFTEFDKLPMDKLLENIDDVIYLNDNFNKIIEEFVENPSKERAFELAIELESSAGESHYQEFMDEFSENKIIQILQNLNNQDNNHIKRIEEYYK